MLLLKMYFAFLLRRKTTRHNNSARGIEFWSKHSVNITSEKEWLAVWKINTPSIAG